MFNHTKSLKYKQFIYVVYTEKFTLDFTILNSTPT